MPETPSPAFHPTRWSLVLQSRGDGERARVALEDLCQAYWFPLYAWSRRFGASPSDAEDYVQGFFVQVLEKRLFADADPAKGKLRTFMLTAFRRHVHDEQRKQARLKRGGGSLVSFDAAQAESWYEAEQVAGESPDHMFDREWALTVLDQAMRALEEWADEAGKVAPFAAMRPFLQQDGDATQYEDAGRSLGMSANAFKVAVHRLRHRFRDALRTEVAATQAEGESVDEEMSYLMRVLHGE